MSTELKPDIDELLSDGEKLDSVLCHAVFQALQAHKRAGNPVAVWRDGEVVWLGPEEIPERAGKTS